jgi:outer membrane protein insertion porin family
MLRATLCLACCLVAAPAAGQAADPQLPAASAAYIGRTVAAVHLLVEGRPAGDPILGELVQTRAGAPLSMAEVRQSIAHLFSLRRFQDVRVEARAAGESVELVYHLVPLRTVSRLQFRGTLGLSEGQLRRTVTERFGASPPIGRATEIARILGEQLYADHGYLRADVRAITVDDPRDAASTVLVFEVDAGPRARIADVQLSGQPGDAGPFLRRLGAVSGAPYEPLRLSGAINKYVEDLRRAGRYEANASYRPIVSEDGTRVGLTIDVEPGPLVTLRFEGDAPPQERIDELVPLRREASAHQDLLEDSEQRIRAYLAQQGYWRAAVSHRVEDDGDQRTIIFTVSRGPQYRLAESVQVTGNRSVPYEELRPMLARLQTGDVFLAAHLDAAVAAIESLYLGRGFAQVSVDAAANETDPTSGGVGQVRPAIVIAEGPRTLVGDVTFLGNEAITDERLASLVTLTPGMPYFVPRIADDRELVLLEYLNEGHASADAQAAPVLSEDGTSASVVYRITEGPQTIVDHILVIGNTRTDPAIIRRELLFRTGEPLGLADLIESRRRLAALGLFRRVQITELSHGGSNEHDVLVTVEEAPRTTLSYGGGLEARQRPRLRAGERVDRIEFAPRGFFDVGRRNVGGKNRSVNLYTRISLRPKDSVDDPDAEGFGFSDYRVVLTYLEPRPYGINGDLTMTGAIEQGVRSSFNFVRKGMAAELHRRLSPLVRTSGRYSLAKTRIFDARLDEEDQALIDRRFPGFRLSTLAAAISRDTRDDVLEPTRGMFVGIEGSVAARALGGELGFVKGYGQALWFTRVPGRRSVVFATRLAVGLADGFPRLDEQVNEDGEIEVITTEDIPASERFFAGGDTTIRGFALDTVGAGNTISPQGFPRGGNAVLLMNGELRVPVTANLGAALFLDGGNVYERLTDFSPEELRGSYGFGVRYRSPLGPIRFDLGFKIAPRPNESSRAFHFSFGQAF